MEPFFNGSHERTDVNNDHQIRVFRKKKQNSWYICRSDFCELFRFTLNVYEALIG